MIFFKRFLFNRVFICFLTATFSILSFASSAPAMFIPSPYEENGTSHRDTDLQRIQKLLESKLVQYKLSKLGLTKDEIQERLHQLDNEQLHLIASQIHTLESGGYEPETYGEAIAYLFLLILAPLLILLFLAIIFSGE